MTDPIATVRERLRRDLQTALVRRLGPHEHASAATWSLTAILVAIDEVLGQPAAGTAPLVSATPYRPTRDRRGRYRGRR